jgi:hypothetical protein
MCFSFLFREFFPMHRIVLPAALAAAAFIAPPLLATDARAHAVAGARVFISTLTIDDPGVADEASLPTFSWQPNANGGALQNQYVVNVEFDKRITEHLGVGLNYGLTALTTQGAKTRSGFQNLVGTVKYQAYTNAEHEFIVSVGVSQGFGGTGNVAAGADTYGTTTPTLYWGKGLGDLPIGYLRPLALSGTLGYSFANVGLKTTTAIDPDSGMATVNYNNGNNNAWAGGVALQYSIPYLTSQVKDFGLPGWVNRLTPVVELTWVSAASRPSQTLTRYQLAPGLAYSGDAFQLAAELLIPLNAAAGSSIGFIAQFHLYFDDIFPSSLGKPLVRW